MSDRITIVGNIANDPQQNATRTGDPATSFRVATSHRFRDDEGQWRDTEPSYYAVSCFRGLAVHAMSSLHKGERVIVTGALKIKRWARGDKSGTDAEITADALGHDLKFGTTSYTRVVGAASSGSARTDGPAPESEQAWADAESAGPGSGSALGVQRDTAESDSPGHWPVTPIGQQAAEPVATPY